MKPFFATLIILFFSIVLPAQPYDLNYFIEQAKKNSPLIFKKQIENKVIETETKRLKAFFTQPRIAFDANILFAPIINTDKHSFQWISSGAEHYTGYDLAISDGGQYQAVVEVEQPLFGGKKLNIINQHIDIARKKNISDIAITEKELKKIVGYQYLRCLESQKTIHFIRQILKTLQHEKTILTTLVENAIYKPSDIQRLKIEMLNYKAKLSIAKNQAQQNLYDLKILCGIEDTNAFNLQDISLKQSHEIIVDANSVFYNQYELDSLNLQMQQAVSELKYQPQISAFANGGLNAVYLPGLNRLGIGLGLKLSWTLFDGHQRNFNREKTTFLLQNIAFRKQYFFSQRQLKLSKLNSEIKNIDQQIAIKQETEKAYNNLLKTYDIELSQGTISIIDFINTLRDMTALKQSILLLKMQKQALINTYNYWNE